MGRGGKKKGKKKAEDIDLGSLSLEDQPSSSTTQVPQAGQSQSAERVSQPSPAPQQPSGQQATWGGGQGRGVEHAGQGRGVPHQTVPSRGAPQQTAWSGRPHEQAGVGRGQPGRGRGVQSPPQPTSGEAGHGRGMQSQPQPAWGGPAHGRDVQNPPQPAWGGPAHGRGVQSPPQPASGEAGHGRGMQSQPQPAWGGPAHGRGVETPPQPTSGGPGHGRGMQSQPQPAWGGPAHGRGMQSQPQPAWGGPAHGRGVQTPPQPTSGGPGHGRGMKSQPQPAWGGPAHGRGVQSPPQSTSGGPAHGRGAQSQPQPAWDRPQLTTQQASPPIQAEEQAQPSQSKTASQEQPIQRTSGSKAPGSVVCRFQIPKKIRSKVLIPSDATRVLTNYLPMNVKPLKIHRYDVAIKPERPKKFFPKIFQTMKAKHFPRNVIAFDQMKNCYAIQSLIKSGEGFSTEVEIKDDNGKLCKYEVALKLTGVVDLAMLFSYMKDGTALSPPTEAIQCIDVILRQGALENYVKASRQYFLRPRNPIDLGDGLEMWTGLFQSAIFTSRPFINIDVAHKGFPRCQPLIDTYSRDFRLDLEKQIERQRKMECELFCKFIRGLRVVAQIGDAKTGFRKREFICNDIKPPANMLKFTMQDEKGQTTTVTVEQYFVNKGYRLRYPNLNCIWVGPRDKEIYYPMELLDVAYGQPLNRQLNERQLSKMVREAATPPSDRKRKIEEVIRDMKYSSNEYFKEFGLSISTNFFEVDAKVLHPPILNVGEGTVRPRNGAWLAKKLLKPSALQSWGFLVVETDPNRLQCHEIIKKIQGVGTQMGMSVQNPALTNFNVKANELLSIFRRASDSKITFLFVIVGSWSRNLYQKVKKMAELEVGILTQCIKDVTAEKRMNEQTIRNILLKVNSKLMGVNQTLGNMSEPPCLKAGGVMVVGADVTHPSPDQTDIPSIAAVTASFDAKCFQYNIELSIQTPKKEVIVEFEGMMVEHLKVYKKHQNALPRKIFIFRDGVSEGQFAQVMNSELVAAYRAYERLAGNNVKPEVLFLLVQKRHHTRFFLGANNTQNVLPGTVVDKEIVHNSEMDFYLVSHQAIKGTARPTRYYGVRNDGNISIEEVEQLTFYLCHLYSRCTRSVSLPTPTYYAHLACTRAKNLTFGDRFNNRELEIRPQRLQVLNKMLDFSRMFFV